MNPLRWGVSMNQTSLKSRLIFGGGVLLLLAVFANVLWNLALAGVSLIILFGVGIVLIGMIQALPLLGQKWENILLDARMREARERPIQQVANSILERERYLNQTKQVLEQMKGKLAAKAQQVNDRRRNSPTYDPTRHLNGLAQEDQKLQSRTKKYAAAVKALDDLKMAFEDMKFDFQFAQDMESIKALNSMATGQEVLDNMMTDTAFTEVRNRYNAAFQDLDAEVEQINSANALTYQGENLISISDLTINRPADLAKAKLAIPA